jgi:hypothetical protein
VKADFAPNSTDYPSAFLIFVKSLRRSIAAGGLLLILAIAGHAATMSHNTDQTAIVANNSISCNLAGSHADNSYWRTYTPAFYHHVGNFAITGIRIGIEEAIAGTGPSQPITIRIYANSGGAFPGGTRTLIGTTATTVPNGTLFFQDIPVAAPAQPASTEIVVEVFTPDGQAVGNRFFIGSNNLGENAPGYISAADCGAPNPVTLASAGAPNMAMHIVLVGSGPTAAGVSISGRVLTSGGGGLTNATVALTDSTGQTRTTRTSSFGYYLFDDLSAGQSYVITVNSKRYSYASHLVTANGVISGEDFVPEGTLIKGGTVEAETRSPRPPSLTPEFGTASP